jgi:hypothetical protein
VIESSGAKIPEVTTTKMQFMSVTLNALRNDVIV